MTTPRSENTPPSTEVPGAAKKAEERSKAAIENTREGYGHSPKASIISGKPDGDTQGGPGSNNDNANTPKGD